MSLDRLVVKVILNIDNDNQEKVEDSFKKYNDYIEEKNIVPDKEEHNKLCLAYITYQVGKSKDK